MKPESEHQKSSVIVVGGGPAGYFAALRLAAQRPDVQVTVVESGKRTLRKVKISGGGRCNVTHACFDPVQLAGSYPRGGTALLPVFAQFQPRDTIAWFSERQVRLKEESDGRMFPVTDSSQTVIDCLESERRRLGVGLLTGTNVELIERRPEHFAVTLEKDGTRSVEYPAALILACGTAASGSFLPAQLGHQLIPCVPSLFTFEIADSRLSELAGVAVEDVRCSLTAGGREFQDRGPVLVTHWGLSGPSVIRLSAWAARELEQESYRAALTVCWAGGSDIEGIRTELKGCRDQMAKSLVRAHPLFDLPRRLWSSLVAASGIVEADRWGSLRRDALERLAQELAAGRYEISGKGVFKEEFVTCGGVPLAEVDLQTMESRVVPKLFFAGEMLDVDGITGGYNFQNAWSTGWVAGSSVAAKV